MNLLIYEYRAGGHYLEHINHLAEFVSNKQETCDHYFFCIPFNFKEFFQTTYHKIRNRPFITVIETDFDISNAYMKASGLKKIYLEFTIFRNLIKKHKIDIAYTITFQSLSIPLMFWKPQKIEVRSILLFPYIRVEKKTILAKLKWFLKEIQYQLLVSNGCVSKIFVLNDMESTRTLNSKFSTQKFVYLPDPIILNESNPSKFAEIQEELNYDVILLHMGSLDPRKGTLETIKSLEYLPLSGNKKGILIIAGNCSETFDKQIIDQINQLKNPDFKILYLRKFIDYHTFSYFFSKADVIIAAYKQHPFPSGILNHAIYNKKPILVTNYGFMGEVVSANGFGAVVDCCNEEEIAAGVNHILNKKNNYSDLRNYDTYISEHSATLFASTILT